VNDPVITSLSAAAYEIPTDAPEADGTLCWTSTTLVVVEASCGDHVGIGWTYGAAACATLATDVLADVVVGRPVLDVPGSWQAMVDRVRNIGRAGVAGYAISAVDVALWDLKARLLDVPLHRLFGVYHDDVPLYGSGGFTTYDDRTTRKQLQDWLSDGMEAVKIKIGESRGHATARDLRRSQLARETVGDEVEVFVDANGGYSVKQAVRVGRALDDLGVTWFEEPVSSDDLRGLAVVRAAVQADVTAGEYGTDVVYFRRMCDSGIDCLQADATRCGGYTEWFRVAAVAAAFGFEVSAHCAPQLHAHAAVATPNLRHVEWFHDHVRIEQMAFDGALRPERGRLRLSDEAGAGLAVKVSDLADWRVR
jgi:L-alanine-DL-glutamate epimerase-like enolase superfamily enzyme